MKNDRSKAAWALAIHGGAGDLGADGLPAERERAVRAALGEILGAAARILAEGGTSLDAVGEAVRLLEDSPLFNAGKGSVFNARGEHELDASIMDGATLSAGAVAGLTRVKNPIVLARRVMAASPHVFLAGEGALEFAKAERVALVEPEYFSTEDRRRALERARADAARSAPTEPETVGAVALDVDGHLAAATSTGGLTNKLPGRVSDSAIIGAGTYASDASCAVSCTGQGEFFIRGTAARDVAALLEYAGADLRSAAESVLRERVEARGGRGGLIALDRIGRIVCPFDTDAMYRAYTAAGDEAVVAIGRGEPDGNDESIRRRRGG
ncbi:MAG TPA: isoaspartyl peptidase/L-asparaginase [Gammaproteobacteria bacterium]|nr:isoaspartyl peptidase/L-asparaginase [Gammaproteobacteria bacterium]